MGQEEVKAYQAIQALLQESDSVDGGISRKAFLQTLCKHDDDDDLRANLGLNADGETKVMPAFMNAFHAEAKDDMEGVIAISDVITFLAKFKSTGHTQKPTSQVASLETTVPPLVLPQENTPFVMEFSSSEMSQTARPVTSRKVPARFRNRPATSRRPPTSKASTTAAPKPSQPAPKKIAKVVKQEGDAIKPGSDSYKAIEELIEKTDTDVDGHKKRGSFLETLDKHNEDEDLRARLGLPTPKDGNTKAVVAFRGAFDEYVTAFTEKKHEGKVTAEEVANFLSKYRNTVLRVLGVC